MGNIKLQYTPNLIRLPCAYAIAPKSAEKPSTIEAKTLQYQSHRLTTPLSYEIETVQKKQEREMTTARKRIFLQILEDSRGIISATCQKANIARATYYVWMKTDPKFKESVQEIQAAKPDMLEDRMYVLAFKGEFRAIKYLMDKIHPDFKAQPNKNKETVVHIHHHATPPGEKENTEINLGIDELLIIAKEHGDLSQLTPEGMKTYKKYKRLADFIKYYYGITDEMFPSLNKIEQDAKNSEKEKKG